MVNKYISILIGSFVIPLVILASSCSSLTNTITTTPIADVADTRSSISSKPIISPGDNVTEISALLVDFTLDDLIKNTETAVTGRVVEILPAKEQEDELGKPRIFTDVIIQPENFLYGESKASSIAVRVEGGRIGNMVTVAEDEAEFILGEECTVFLIHPKFIYAIPDRFTNENYYIVWAGVGGKYELKDGTLVNNTDKRFSLTDVEQKVATIRGTN